MNKIIIGFLGDTGVGKTTAANALVAEGFYRVSIAEKISEFTQQLFTDEEIAENKDNLAILEINPLSYGHSLVISKQHDKLPSSAFSLASKIAKRLKSKFKADEVKIENSQVMGHNLINVIPIYTDIKLEKKKAEEKELILLQDKLKSKPKSHSMFI